jgi:hypothetical protein
MVYSSTGTPLLAALVLQAAKPVPAAPEVVEVAGVQVAAELVVGREPAVRGEQQELRLDALQVAVLLELLGEGGEGLVHRVGGNGADGAAKYVRLDKPHGGGEVRGRQPLARVVVIELEQERVRDIDLQLAQVVEGQAEGGIWFSVQGQGAEVACEGADVLHQGFHARLGDGLGLGVVLEGFVDLALARDLAGAHGQVVAHERIELGAVGLLPEVLLHGSPVLLVQAGLQFGLEAHQDEVPDEIGLAQLLAGRVHALEDELGVVLTAGQRDVHHDQLGEALAHGSKIAVSDGEELRKEVEVAVYADRSLFGRLAILDDGLQGRVVDLGEEELVVAVTAFELVDQVVMPQLVRGEAFEGLGGSNGPRECLQQQHDGGQPLLPIDHQQGRLGGNLRRALFDVDD